MFDTVKHCTQKRQNRKFYNFCCFTQKFTNWISRLRVTWALTTKCTSELSNIKQRLGTIRRSFGFFRAFAIYTKRHKDLESHTSWRLENFHGVSVEDVPVVQEIFDCNNFVYNFDIGEGGYAGELARQTIEKFIKTVELLRSTIIVFIYVFW